MTVWLVWSWQPPGKYNDEKRRLAGIYSTREKAERTLKSLVRNGLDAGAEEWSVDANAA